MGTFKKEKRGPKLQIKAWVALVVTSVKFWQIVIIFYPTPP
jgi:hypothetical protein